MLRIAAICALFLSFVTTRAVEANLIVNVNYSGDAQYASAFTNAAAIWQSLLLGYQDGTAIARTSGSSYGIGQTLSTVFINANVSPIDGVGQILGSAGPTQAILDSLNYILATDGVMTFDSADVAILAQNNLLEAVVLHEMGHVLGFGTLWTLNGVYVNGTGEFTGANASAAWRNDFGQSGTPDVELGGGAGTANGHWNEVDGGAGPTGIVDSLGRDMRNELMTGWLNSNPFISNMTLASFRDIGFTTTAAVPEPSLLTAVFAGIASFGLALRRSKQVTTS